jgi:voltage-gated potassium channel
VNVRRRLVLLVGLLASVTVIGTVGFTLIEGWPVFDALYMTIITLGSVGFGEVHPLSVPGRAFTMVLIVTGLGVVAYGLSTITALWVEGDLSHLWEKRRMERRIEDLTDHIVVCGGDETGRHIMREFRATRTPFVCIEMNAERAEALRRVVPDVLYIVGDATETEVMRAAQVQRARGLIAAMPADKDNLFALLTARELNPRLRIVSRISGDEARARLLKAGADAVVSNKSIGALRIASEMLRPHVVSVLDAMLREPSEVRVQEIPVGAGAAGQSLASLKFHERAGVIVFALRDATTQRHVFNPPAERPLVLGDVLIACADAAQLGTARRIAMEG